MSQFDFTNMFKQFGGIKEQMEQAKERVSRLKITGEAGAGMVRAVVTGEGNLEDLQIENNLLAPEQKDMLIELVISAINEANKKSKEAAAHEMKGVVGGLNIPGLDKILGGLG